MIYFFPQKQKGSYGAKICNFCVMPNMIINVGEMQQ